MMKNMIEMADEVGASVHEVGEHNSVIIFTEEQLNDFVNKIDVRGWLAEMFDNEETNNPYVFDPMKDDLIPVKPRALTHLLLKEKNK
jgi:hypothetical protein